MRNIFAGYYTEHRWDALPRYLEHNEHELDHLKVRNALGTNVGLHPALTAGLPWRRNSGANKHLTGNLV